MNMKIVSEEHACYSMSAKNKPVLTVNQGEIFRLETKDCYSNNLKTEEDFFTREMWNTVNPATGPVFINGTKKSDILKIEILEIKIRDFAIMSLEHGSGALGEFIEGQETTVCVETDGAFYFIGSAKTLDECGEIVLKKGHASKTETSS